MRPQQRRQVVLMVVVVVVVLTAYCSGIFLQTPIQTHTHTQTARSNPERREDPQPEERHSILEQDEEEGEEEEKKRNGENQGETKTEERKEEGKDKEGGGGKIIRKGFWVDELEETSLISVNMEEMEKEMKRRKRRVEERCEELFTEEKRREINSKEFLVSIKYKLIWCNIFKSASSTWMYNYLKMAGRTDDALKNLRTSPVETARKLYPRPSPGELHTYLQNGAASDGSSWKGEEERFLSFIIVREPFQRLLSAYRDKIEKSIPFYRSLRCEMTGEEGKRSVWKWGKGEKCSPTFPQFVDYVLKVEKSGEVHNEHWAPYYKFCTPCSTHFDFILRFENLRQDEMYLLEKVPGLSDVVSPKVIHSSHTDYSDLLTKYYSQLTPAQLLGLIKIYQPDFWLFGYDERPYLDLVG